MLHNRLKLHRLLLIITAIAFLTAQTQARPAMLVNSYSVDSFDDSVGDPLNPSILGESMSMPLPLWMIHAAINAGIAKDSKALYAYDDGLGGYAGSSNEIRHLRILALHQRQNPACQTYPSNRCKT